MPATTPFKRNNAAARGSRGDAFSAARLIVALAVFAAAAFAQVEIRVNQVGYLPNETKKAIVFSKSAVDDGFVLVDAVSNAEIMRGKLSPANAANWGAEFPFYYEADFSASTAAGRRVLKVGGAVSREFAVGEWPAVQEDLLFFMRQQRCGYNPFLDAVCHKRDGRSVYAPVPDGAFIDASGGWHDAGDQLKYLITASNATARMLLAYELAGDRFDDRVDELGRDRPNGVADVLDEAKWGLDWLEKLHPKADWLFHQVADDRDHRGFKLPADDNADYGWGKNSYRPVYFADGKPQGLREFKSRSTGVANIAGRSAAAFAIAARLWRSDLRDANAADRYRIHAEQLYALGKAKEGFQQGNSYGAPYRYNEDTWADDMEWAAAELYKLTKKPAYLADAARYARMIGAASWTQHETAEHYQFYPFMNVGHFALYPLVGASMKKELAGYYRANIEHVAARAKTNSYGVGVPFLWCSNNLVVNFVTEIMLYERMTGDRRYRELALAHRDWLFGRNPWGTSMFEGVPAGGETPEDTHLPTVQILKRRVVGGLVDGPILAETYATLRGLTLTKPDEFAALQPRGIVYHDDVGDYSTNEPTMDGTADAILMTALFSRKNFGAAGRDPRFRWDLGAVTRGDATRKKLALVFTGDEFGDGAAKIAETLKRNGVAASFFFTGRFYRNPEFGGAIRRLKADGHYLGAHSDAHLLYADWNDRRKTLVTKEEFDRDLDANYAAMRRFGILSAPIFLPPFEWHNADIASWTAARGLRLVNFTPGTGSNADYTTPSMKNYVASDAILDKIKAYEAKDPHSLGGFILLLHAGVAPERTDKFYDRLDELIGWLKSKGYEMERVDALLK